MYFEKILNMRKLVLFWVLLGVSVALCAQPAKKTRNAASNSKEAVTERKISSRFNMGLRAYYTAQYDEAVQIFSGILSDAPKHAPSYYMLSRVYTGQQRYVEAESACQQAVKLDKNNIWYQVALAEAYLTNENFKAALPIWEKVCHEFPDNLGYLFALARCYEKTGNAAKSEEILEQLAQLKGEKYDSAEPVKPADPSSGSKVKGIALLRVKDYAEAVVTLEQALREDDTDYDVWAAYTEAVSKSGQWRKLIDKEEDMTILFPQSAALLAALADAFLHEGQDEKAVEYYKQALAFSYDAELTKAIRKGLVDAYTRLGDTDSAARYR